LAAIQLIFLLPDIADPWGSTMMRGHQLCEIAQHHLAEKFDCKIMRMPLSSKRQSKRNFKAAQQMAWMARCPRDAIYFVTKQCVERLNPTAAEILRWRARAVLFDYVDTDMETVLTRGADIHLCASNAQYEYMKQKKQFSNTSSVSLLPHGYDYRLQTCAPTKGPVYVTYWGALRNTYIPQSILNDISVIDGAVAPTTETLDELSRYRLHYCVRKNFRDVDKTIFKPLTKVANAAACGANILINHDAHDAVDFLGPDYPYFVGLGDDANIANVFQAALNGAGGSDWLYARNAMNSVAKHLSPEQVANQLYDILRPLTE
jgi:hypothetical protein